MTSFNSTDIKKSDDFEELLNAVKDNTSLIDELTDEQVTELRKKISPYGRTIQGSDKVTVMSVTNMSEYYMRRFLMTSLIGFLYRKCDEHLLDDGEPPCHMDNYTDFMDKYTTAIKEAEAAKVYLEEFSASGIKESSLSIAEAATLRENRSKLDRGEGFKKRLIIRQFLDDNFSFNPDKHVRSAYFYNESDPERVKPKQVVIREVEDTNILADPDLQGYTKTNSSKRVESVVSANDKEKRETSDHVKHIPPADIFHRWEYYTDSNFEEIRDAVTDIYADKPDFELAVNPYDTFSDTADSTAVSKAEAFVNKHKGELITDVLTVKHSSWNLLGPFKENRARIDFYNSNTGIIEGYFKQLENDKKLGADLMRKRVHRVKSKNIKEVGNDAKFLEQYKNVCTSDVKNLGAEDVRKDKNLKSVRCNFTLHRECPYDAVQVDVFDLRKGGSTLKKTEFFTQAEAPQQLNTPNKL